NRFSRSMRRISAEASLGSVIGGRAYVRPSGPGAGCLGIRNEPRSSSSDACGRWSHVRLKGRDPRNQHGSRTRIPRPDDVRDLLTGEAVIRPRCGPKEHDDERPFRGDDGHRAASCLSPRGRGCAARGTGAAGKQPGSAIGGTEDRHTGARLARRARAAPGAVDVVTGSAPIIESMSGRLVSPITVGRAVELTAIAAGLDAARDGDASTLLLAGEAGVGKSRLVEEAMRLAGERGMRVLRGACVNIGAAGVPYGPIVEALRELHRELSDEELDALVGHSGADLARLLPAFAPSVAQPEPTAQSQWLQACLLEAILGLVQRLAERAPVLLVVEDLHWADPGTRETLTYLVRNLRSDATSLLITYRSDELHRRHPLLPWLAELERTGRVQRVDVARLEPARTRELVSAILEGDADPDLAARVVERSDGNPF